MHLSRTGDRPVQHRREPLPTLQRLVDRAAGSTAMTVLVNVVSPGQLVPEHVHEVEEVLLVVSGACTISVGDEQALARTGDAVIVPPAVPHSFRHAGNGAATVIAVLASPDVVLSSRPENG